MSLSLYLGVGVAFAAVMAYLAGKERETGGPWMAAAVLVTITVFWPVLVLAWVWDQIEGE